MNLLFQNSQGNERLIAEVNSIDNAYEEINKFLNDHNFKSYYMRIWEKNERMIIDVGSHTEYFIIEGYK